MLEIKNLYVTANNKEIIKNLNLQIKPGEIHVLMGPNGTGKSTICKTIMHDPDYLITKGEIIYENKVLNNLNATEISRLGIFLLSQSPVEIEGITNAELLRTALSEKTGEKVDIFKFNERLNEICKIINLPKDFVHRDVNYNMSGGEKKKNELLQLFVLEPNFIILDEIDSGLDIDALKTVGNSLKQYYDAYKPSILIVTHHDDILSFFPKYQVHILKDGEIVKSGNETLVKKIIATGFEANALSENDQNE